MDPIQSNSDDSQARNFEFSPNGFSLGTDDSQEEDHCDENRPLKMSNHWDRSVNGFEQHIANQTKENSDLSLGAFTSVRSQKELLESKDSASNHSNEDRIIADGHHKLVPDDNYEDQTEATSNNDNLDQQLNLKLPGSNYQSDQYDHEREGTHPSAYTEEEKSQTNLDSSVDIRNSHQKQDSYQRDPQQDTMHTEGDEIRSRVSAASTRLGLTIRNKKDDLLRLRREYDQLQAELQEFKKQKKAAQVKRRKEIRELKSPSNSSSPTKTVNFPRSPVGRRNPSQTSHTDSTNTLITSSPSSFMRSGMTSPIIESKHHITTTTKMHPTLSSPHYSHHHQSPKIYMTPKSTKSRAPMPNSRQAVNRGLKTPKSRLQTPSKQLAEFNDSHSLSRSRRGTPMKTHDNIDPADQTTIRKDRHAEDQGFLNKVEGKLGTERYRKICAIFEHYSATGRINDIGDMDLTQYHRFMKENQLYSSVLTPSQADLLFFKDNKSKTLNLKRFLKLVFIISQKSIVSVEPMEAFGQTIDHLTMPILQQVDRLQRAYQIRTDEFDHPKVQARIHTYSGVFKQLFKLYRTMGLNEQNAIDLKNYLRLLRDHGVVPDLLSKASAVEFFKLSQKKGEMVTKFEKVSLDEFIECLTVSALEGFTDPKFQNRYQLPEDRVDALFRMVELASKYLPHSKVIDLRFTEVKRKMNRNFQKQRISTSNSEASADLRSI